MKRKKRIKWNNIILFIVIIIFILIFSFSLINIIKWKLDSDHTHKEVNNINDSVKIEEVEDNENTEIVEQEEIDEFNPYWDYIKMNLINVDFNELKKKNDETAGWIQVSGTNINYPFVHTKDNAYYLTHSFDKSYNNAGWVFLDYRNDVDVFNRNNIIYAHGRLDQIMFGSLKNILNNGWLENTNNYVVKLSTENENTLWQVFSVYRIPTTNDYLKISFINDNEFLDFANMLKKRSQYNFNTNLLPSDKIITLSTCYNDSDKFVLHAKLIKKERR